MHRIHALFDRLSPFWKKEKKIEKKKRKRIEKPFHKPAFQETLLPAKCVESLHNRPFHAIMLVEWT